MSPSRFPLPFIAIFPFLFACSPAAIPEISPFAANNIDSVLSKPNLKVLDIGNSYTNDATAYLPHIIEQLSIDISDLCLYKLTCGGASFMHWVQIYNNNFSGNYEFSKIIGNLSVETPESNSDFYDGNLFQHLINEEQWDIILIHQLGRFATAYDAWNDYGDAGYLKDLARIIASHQPGCVVGYLFTHSPESNYPTNTEKSSYKRWENSISALKRLMTDYNIQFIIPCGTAIQNLRETHFNTVHDLTRDGAHLGFGLARYTAACCYYEALIAPRSRQSIVGTTISLPINDDPSTSQIKVTDENMIIAQKAASLACKFPDICINPYQYELFVQ